MDQSKTLKVSSLTFGITILYIIAILFIIIFFLMTGQVLLIFPTIFLLVGVRLFVRGLMRFTEKRLIENVPTSKIHSIAMGLVKINGEVVPAEKHALKSPLSGRDCVYYRYRIEEMMDTGRGPTWSPISLGERSPIFFLKDNTGLVLVNPEKARVEISSVNECKSGRGKDPPQKVLEFLESVGIKHKDSFGLNKKMRFVEQIIAPYDKLYILGTASDNPYVEESTAMHSSEDIMIDKGKFEKFYVISDRPEKEFTSLLGRKSMTDIFVGIILIPGCVALTLISMYYAEFLWQLFMSSGIWGLAAILGIPLAAALLCIIYFHIS